MLQVKGRTLFVAIHVNEKDPARMNMALNNAQNVHNDYTAQGDEVLIEMAADRPGSDHVGSGPVAGGSAGVVDVA